MISDMQSYEADADQQNAQNLQQSLKNNYKKNITRMFLKYLSTCETQIHKEIKSKHKNVTPDVKKLVKEYNLRVNFEDFLSVFPILYLNSDISNKELKLQTYFQSVNQLYQDIFISKKKK